MAKGVNVSEAQKVTVAELYEQAKRLRGEGHDVNVHLAPYNQAEDEVCLYWAIGHFIMTYYLMAKE